MRFRQPVYPQRSKWPICSSARTAVNRTTATERTAGFRNMPKGCSKCGFGFLFELLDDYYPAPNAAFFVCDQEGRIIGCGRGSRELTGLSDEKVIGRPVREVLGLDFEGGEDHVGTVARVGRAPARQAASPSTPRAICPPRRLRICFRPTMTTAGSCSS